MAINRELKRQAESGDGRAMHKLALAYLEEKDMDQALEWMEKAANLGIVDAQMEMAAAGHFMEDPEMKFYWVSKAAKTGHIGAIGALAACYLRGEGTSQDIGKAIQLLQQASDGGDAEAKRRLGAAYIEGIGVSANESKGMSLLREAASLGDDEAKELLRKISSGQVSTRPSSGKSGCYVATCVYGSYDCPEVWTLRRFRDATLKKSWFGRLFIRIYYMVSPHIVKLFGGKLWFNKLWKPIIHRFVALLQNKGVESSSYYDV